MAKAKSTRPGPRNIDWAVAEHEYVHGYTEESGVAVTRPTLAQLADRHGITKRMMERKSAELGWTEKRAQAQQQVMAQAAECATVNRATVIARCEDAVLAQAEDILAVTGRLTRKYADQARRDQGSPPIRELKQVVEALEKTQTIVLKSKMGDDPGADTKVQAILDGLAEIRRRRLREASDEEA